MVEFSNKKLEELKKMASKKNIQGRSKMNKSQLIQVLSNKNNKSKKIYKLKGGMSINEINQIKTNMNSGIKCFFKFSEYEKIPKKTIKEIIYNENNNKLYITLESGVTLSNFIDKFEIEIEIDVNGKKIYTIKTIP